MRIELKIRVQRLELYLDDRSFFRRLKNFFDLLCKADMCDLA